MASVARHLEAVPGAVHHRGSNSGTNTSQVSDKASDTTAAEDVAEDSSEDGPDESTVLLKSRLLPTDVFGKGSPTLRKREEGQPHTNVNITAHPPARSGVLDIVITHFDAENVNQMIDYWLNFLQSKKVSSRPCDPLPPPDKDTRKSAIFLIRQALVMRQPASAFRSLLHVLPDQSSPFSWSTPFL